MDYSFVFDLYYLTLINSSLINNYQYEENKGEDR
jgi:hypothetical protein